MSFKQATPSASTKSGAMVKMTIKPRVGNSSIVRIFINRKFAFDELGSVGVGDKVSVYFGQGENAGAFSIAKDEKANVELKNYGKHTYSLSLDAWHGLTNGDMPSKPCTVIVKAENSIICKNPHA